MVNQIRPWHKDISNSLTRLVNLWINFGDWGAYIYIRFILDFSLKGKRNGKIKYKKLKDCNISVDFMPLANRFSPTRKTKVSSSVNYGRGGI